MYSGEMTSNNSQSQKAKSFNNNSKILTAAEWANLPLTNLDRPLHTVIDQALATTNEEPVVYQQHPEAVTTASANKCF